MGERATATTTTTTTANNTTNNNATDGKATEKNAEQIRIEFYKTYDVMTGVRIAATLGGFFSLMVLLVVYKTKCKSRSISEENLEATVAAAVVEEEQFGHSLEKAHEFYTRHNFAPIHLVSPKEQTRFSSVGGGYNMFTPPVRLGYSLRGRVSLPTSSPYVYPTVFQPRNLMESPPPKVFREDEEDFESYRRSQNLLRVPSSRRSSRRLSSITCSSCDTSYLERRGSAMEMGRPIPPPFISPSNKSERLVEEEPWDFYYPIDIQVIQPTPEVSPAESMVSVYDCKGHRPMLCVPRAAAPLASISSCRLPSIEQDSPSVGSDSVFLDEELVDTEDEVDEFSTDSDAENLECNIPSKPPEGSRNTPQCSKQTKDHSRVYRVPTRRFSSPNASKVYGAPHFQRVDCANDDKKIFSPSSRLTRNGKNSYKTSSDSDTIHVSRSLDKHLSSSGGQNSKTIPKTSMSASCDHLVKALQEHSSQGDITLKVVEHCTWSQETLF